MAPVVLLLISSITDNGALLKYGYGFLPKQFSMEAYNYLFNQSDAIFTSYLMSIVVTAIGSVSSVLITAMLSYGLARKGLPGRKLLTFIVFFTMLFNGGLVPTYIMYTGTFHIKNTIFALLIPSLLVPAFNVMLMRSYLMTSIPYEIIESALIDGASEFTLFSRIVMPMSVPIIATIFLYQIIAYWNDWKNGLFYITSRTDLYTVQVLLNRMIMNIQYLASASNSVSADLSNIPTLTVRMAIAFIGLIPILIIYPFIQKYFVRGIVLGGVKG
jgi:putative aldouronate transport system permease protein